MVLAYLWLAIESDYNIVVFSENKAHAENFIESLSSFVPLYQSVIDTRCNGATLDQRLNFLNVISSKNINVIREEGFLQTHMPDRIIARDPGKGLDGIFSLSTQGTFFISTISGNFLNSSAIKLLRSKYFRVKESNLHMLDLSVFLEGRGEDYKIPQITEYKWLARGEITLASDDVSKIYQNISICNDNIARTDDILSSKLIKNYSNSNLISIKEAFEEIKSRADFLEELGKSGFKSSQKNPIEMYYEIK
jgi:hypothetical protein